VSNFSVPRGKSQKAPPKVGHIFISCYKWSSVYKQLKLIIKHIDKEAK